MPAERLWILLAKKQTGEATPAESQELEHLLQVEGLSEDSIDVIEKVWQRPINSIPPLEATNGVWDKIQQATTKQRRSATVLVLYKKWISVAAILLVGVSSFFLFTHREQDKVGNGPTARNEINTAPHTKQKLLLPDGTTVWLNGNSKLAFRKEDFGKQEREVQLTGEAFFDVVKNEKVPFVIHAGNVNIKVKGTAFNVKAYPEDKNIETALVRGLVEITTQNDPERKILLKPAEKIIIPTENVRSTNPHPKKGDSSLSQSLYSIVKLASREPEKLAETSWLKTTLEFDNETFEELAPKLESWYTVKLVFEDESIKRRRFSGVIEKETLPQTLEAMALSNPFRYSVNDNTVFIAKKQ